MRLMFVTPSLSNGGAQRVVASLASQLCERHEVCVVCTFPEDNAQGTYPIDPRVEVIEIAANLRWRRPITVWSFISQHRSLARQLRALKRERGIQASASFLNTCNVDNVWSRTDEGVVVSMRNMIAPALGEHGLAESTMRNLVSRTSRAADRVVCISKGVAAEQRDVFDVPEELLRVIYNPADSAEHQMRAAMPLADGAFDRFRATHGRLVATVGRLVPHKGQRHLLRAFAQVRHQIPGAGLLVLGQGSLEAELRELADELGIGAHVHFAGFVSGPERYLSRCDILAMSSLREGLCNTIVEACALGLPVVSTDCVVGPRELLAPDSGLAGIAAGVELAPFGILTPPCSGARVGADEPLDAAEQALADAIAMLLQDESLRERYAEAGLRRTLDFSPVAIARQWEDVFEEVAG